MNHLFETAWGVIANAGGGDWTRESPEWREAAARWRDAYFDAIQADSKDLGSGVWFQSRVSGAWYRLPEAAGDVAAVMVDGRRFRR